jgi:hypothetical protein
MTSEDYRLALLHALHRSLSAELLTLKHEVRERVEHMDAAQRQLTEIECAEEQLTGEL